MKKKISHKYSKEKEEMRLARFMSLAGVASRRKCEDIILTGTVSVNGEIVTKPGTKIKKGDNVLLNGRPLNKEEKVYIMLNKPVGYLCSASDPHGDKKVYDLINIPQKHIFSAGRLDLNSEGLLILTNDGDYAEKLMHPKYQTKKKYIVRTGSPLSSKDLEKIRKGVYDDGDFLKPKSIKEVRKREYLLIMTEGKKREIRRLIRAVNGKVISLKRTAIGSLKLGKLPTGKWKYLSKQEIRESLSD